MPRLEEKLGVDLRLHKDGFCQGRQVPLVCVTRVYVWSDVDTVMDRAPCTSVPSVVGCFWQYSFGIICLAADLHAACV